MHRFPLLLQKREIEKYSLGQTITTTKTLFFSIKISMHLPKEGVYGS